MNPGHEYLIPGDGASITALPKVSLHDHLDGGLRPQTIIELADEIDLDLPADDAASLGEWFSVSSNSGSLVEYLKTFDVTTGVMQTREGLRRVAREFVQDLHADGVVYGEIRWAPEQHLTRGLSLDEVVEAVQDGLDAGVDVLLYPPDAEGQVRALADAVGAGRLRAARVAEAVRRVDALVGAYGPPLGADVDRVEHRRLARRWARATLETPGGWPIRGTDLHLVEVDDDLGGPYPPPSRAPFRDALRDRGIRLRVDPHDPLTPTVVAVFAEPRGWKGRAGLSQESREKVRSAVGRARARGAPAGVVLFADPRLGAELPSGVPVLAAWGGEVLMQEAAAEELRTRC